MANARESMLTHAMLSTPRGTVRVGDVVRFNSGDFGVALLLFSISELDADGVPRTNFFCHARVLSRVTPSSVSEEGARDAIEPAKNLMGAVPYYLEGPVYHVLLSPNPADIE